MTLKDLSNVYRGSIMVTLIKTTETKKENIGRNYTFDSLGFDNIDRYKDYFSNDIFRLQPFQDHLVIDIIEYI